MFYRFFISVLFLCFELPAFAQDYSFNKQYNEREVDGVSRVFETSQVLHGDVFIAEVKDLDHGCSVTVPDGNGRKTFTAITDFSEADKQAHPYEYALISGVIPADRRTKLALLRKYAPAALKLLTDAKALYLYDYESTSNSSEDAAVFLMQAHAIHECIHLRDHLRRDHGDWLRDFHLQNGKTVSAILDHTILLNVLYDLRSEVRKKQDEYSQHFEEAYLAADNGFEILLAELNAYSQAAMTAISLRLGAERDGRSLAVVSTDENGKKQSAYYPTLPPGIPLLVTFIGEYLDLVKSKDSELWKSLLVQDREAIRELLLQAEKVLEFGCKSKMFTRDLITLVRNAFSKKNEIIYQEALGADFHFVLPKQCL